MLGEAIRSRKSAHKEVTSGLDVAVYAAVVKTAE